VILIVGGMKALKQIKITGRKEGNPQYDDCIFKELINKSMLVDNFHLIGFNHVNPCITKKILMLSAKNILIIIL